MHMYIYIELCICIFIEPCEWLYMCVCVLTLYILKILSIYLKGTAFIHICKKFSLPDFRRLLQLILQALYMFF